MNWGVLNAVRVVETVVLNVVGVMASVGDNVFIVSVVVVVVVVVVAAAVFVAVVVAAVVVNVVVRGRKEIEATG